MNKKMLYGIFIIVIITIMCASCRKETEYIEGSIFKEVINGNCQKGPFLNGASLTIYELDNSFIQTGNSFNTQTNDNLGSFSLYNVNLMSNYAKLRADGFYYNEITDLNSTSQITLYSISDVSNKSSVNVNLLTSLEVPRIEYLLSHGVTFANAKIQAQTEVLNIFSISQSNMPESEMLDILQDGDANGVLLAVSLILQGFRTESQLVQLLAEIGNDIKTDGILNDASIGTQLVNDASLINILEIRNNLQNKWQSLGVQSSIPNFEKFLQMFLTNTNFQFNKTILYPYTEAYGINILNDTTVINTTNTYSFAAFLPKGTNLKIVVTYNDNFYCGFYNPSSVVGWTVSEVISNQQTFEAEGDDKMVNLEYYLMEHADIYFEFYENNSATPTRTKTILF